MFPHQSNDQDHVSAYGYQDQNGVEMVPPRFKDAHAFHEGLAAVRGSNGWGFLDTAGHITVSFPNALWLGDINEGISAVGFSSKGVHYEWKLADRSGTIIVSPHYRYIGNFSEGSAPAMVNEKWGFINRSGAWIIEPKFDNAKPFHEGLAAVAVSVPNSKTLAGGFKWGFIDRSGNYAVDPQFADADSFSEGLAPAAVQDDDCYLFGFVDHSGAFEVKPQFLHANQFSEGMAAVAVSKPDDLNAAKQYWRIHHVPHALFTSRDIRPPSAPLRPGESRRFKLWDGVSVDDQPDHAANSDQPK
jgi:WG containing repeat